ncbi:Type II secretion system protein C [Zhongshania aliphaticivorans]|uniref:Type II secretion system protein C n=1 Tax=Zhongshania aliphaticivorans TaxID=1470434 RepID=A0A5S9NCU8_9GAMM|nr:type II secretion system protein N [Zhongshania aliphaticivorans]CAA0087214.1 Type II secretion system protein C [Zhongshania aliphaticivorans]CAA0114305.1 Type II secretion system protein C [Zhongshania aliphaticivorans]
MTLIRLFPPRVAAGVNILLWALFLVCLSSLCWQVSAWLRDPVLPTAAGNNGSLSDLATQSSDPSYNVQSLLAVPLFGVPAVDAPMPDETEQDVRRSTLKITVIGLVAGSDEQGVAVLKHGRITKAYGIGEKIEVPGSVRLLAVYPEYIIIENNRKREKIELDKKTALAGISSAASPSVDDSDTIDLNSTEIRQLIGDARDTVQNSPLMLARFFSASPVNENGNLIGYELKPGRDKRLFDKLSLSLGDVVLSVNGQSVADLQPQELFKLMQNTTSFELLVQRADTILTKRFDI